MYAANIFISKAIRTTREMITKRISGQQKQPGSFILQTGPLSRSYHVAVSICRIYNRMNISQITVILVVSTGFGDDQFFGGYGRCLYVPSYQNNRQTNQL